MQRPLPRGFYERHPKVVARQLLGKVLVRHLPNGGILRGRLVETEAYLGRNDEAAHAYSGKTPRNAVLFGPPGHAYVYFTYGMHYCMNISCQPEDRAGCVLLRAFEPLEGIAIMAANRGMERPANASAAKLKLIAAGPGRLCQALAITREKDNGKDLTVPSDLFVYDDGFKVPRVITSPRVGITRSVDLPLRFSIAGNLFVSGKKT